MKLLTSVGQISIFIFLSSFFSCTTSSREAPRSADPLPSWNEGATKTSIINFMAGVTDPASSYFIEVPDRIAVFDNDGTLWSEQPLYFQMLFALDRVRALASEHPEWLNEQPFQAVLENDMETLSGFREHGIMEIVMATHSGVTTDVFETDVKEWISSAKHPRTGRLYTEMVYQPMLELLEYLRNNEFKTFIVSGGGIDFMRPWVEEVYGIPRDQVVGSSIETKFVIQDETPLLIHEPSIDFVNDKEGKPVGIHRFIGRRPVFAAGNSDGDLAMLQYTAAGEGQSFMLYIHHTDGEREWAYDRESSIGRLDAGLDEATEKGWTLVDMKGDWKVIYPFELH